MVAIISDGNVSNYFNNNSYKKQIYNSPYGFTLIEIMVTLAIMALLILMAAPFATGWASDRSVLDTKNKLSQSYMLAKSYAQRNPNAVTGIVAVSAVSAVGRVLYVCASDSCTAGNALYKTEFDADIKVGSDPFTSVTFNRLALPSITSPITITKGGSNETLTLR